MAVREGTGVDLLLGIGGTPEGIISACAIKCLGGTIQGKLWPKDDEERQRALDAGPRPGPGAAHRRPGQRRERVLRRHRHHRRRAAARRALPRGDGATTQSLVMRSKSGTIRQIDSTHRLSKLRAYSAVDFDRAPLTPARYTVSGRREADLRLRAPCGGRSKHQELSRPA